MSYCRWSTDDFSCDLYCYEDVNGGWTTHVAGMRYPDGAPKTDHLIRNGMFAEWVAARKEQSKWLKSVRPTPIGLPFDGQTFNDPTLETFRERLILLRSVGYRFPDEVIEAVDEEIAEAAAHDQG